MKDLIDVIEYKQYKQLPELLKSVFYDFWFF